MTALSLSVCVCVSEWVSEWVCVHTTLRPPRSVCLSVSVKSPARFAFMLSCSRSESEPTLSGRTDTRTDINTVLLQPELTAIVSKAGVSIQLTLTTSSSSSSSSLSSSSPSSWATSNQFQNRKQVRLIFTAPFLSLKHSVPRVDVQQAVVPINNVHLKNFINHLINKIVSFMYFYVINWINLYTFIRRIYITWQHVYYIIDV